MCGGATAGSGGSGIGIIYYCGTAQKGIGGVVKVIGGNTYHYFYSSGDYKASSTALPAYNFVISAATANFNLRNSMIAAGYSGSGAFVATVTINAGAYIYSTSIANPAFTTGSLTGGDINIINNGHIVGKGGKGGIGSNGSPNPLTAGGLALQILAATKITNNGTIGGGGGGGGGAGFNRGPSGGGGGAGFGCGSGCQGGANGSLTTGGAGAPGGGSGGQGGSGGSLGGTGGNGPSYTYRFVTLVATSAGQNGAAGGAAVSGNSLITWLVTGTRLGTIS
jgi:hypothetical protein